MSELVLMYIFRISHCMSLSSLKLWLMTWPKYRNSDTKTAVVYHKTWKVITHTTLDLSLGSKTMHAVFLMLQHKCSITQYLSVYALHTKMMLIKQCHQHMQIYI